MTVLIDTNVLLRSAQRASPQQPLAIRAVAAATETYGAVYLAAQSVYEFWVVATRPPEHNGMGMEFGEVDRLLEDLTCEAVLLFDSAAAHTIWRRLVVGHRVYGKSAHDARIDAVMIAHGIERILTFDSAGFARFPGITVIDPQNVSGGA